MPSDRERYRLGINCESIHLVDENGSGFILDEIPQSDKPWRYPSPAQTTKAESSISKIFSLVMNIYTGATTLTGTRRTLREPPMKFGTRSNP